MAAASSSLDQAARPHLVLIPSAGMGHVHPHTRLAAALSGHGCDVSVVHTLPTVSAAESQCYADFFAAYPSIRPIPFQLPEFDAAAYPPGSDPFLLRMEALRKTASHMAPLLGNASPAISALVVDIALVSSHVPLAKELQLPIYILAPSCAEMLSFNVCFPKLQPDGVDLPGLWRVPRSWIPSSLLDPGHLFAQHFAENGRHYVQASGILLNTFHTLEAQALSALRDGLVVPGLPPVFGVGPLMPANTLQHDQQEHKQLGSPHLSTWLDEQPEKSVVYVSFGNRSAMSRDQIKQLASGLEASGRRFLWAVKTAVVDRDEQVDELGELLGDGYLDRVKGRGLVTNGWVEQEQVLQHAAIGLYVSHCGWNSVVEAATYGVPILGWPRGGDQRINADMVRRSGLGVWMEEWSWEAEEKVVSGEEIAKALKQVAADETVKTVAARLSKEAAVAGGLVEFVNKLKSN